MTSSIDSLPTLAPPAARFAADELRVDGRAKVTGEAAYTADFARPGMLWAAFVASPVPHARIVSIDSAEARAMPGVHAVLTGAEIGAHYFGRRYCDWPVLALERVRFVGEYVVAVAADTPEIVEAAAATIHVTYDELPALFDTEIALTPEAPVLHEDHDRYPLMFPKRMVRAHNNVQGHGVIEEGDIAAAFAAADRVFEHTFTTPRYHGGYLEPRATLVWIEDDLVNVYSTTKSPFLLRQQFSVCTGLPEERFVVHPAFIGGDFGAKGLCIEEFACYYLAAATGRAVKCVRSYTDDIRSTNVRHASRTRVRTAVKNDGTILGQDIDVLFDGGAYAAGKPLPSLLPGLPPKLPYRIGAVRLERTCVYTNTIPGCFIRAPGDVQIMFGLESALDLIAGELGIDPLALRRRNAAVEGDHDIEGGLMLEPRAIEVLDAIERESNWHAPLPAGRGRGMSLTIRHTGNGAANAQLLPQPNGDILVRTGTTEQGMGVLTALQRVVAVELGLPFERVRAERGGTDIAAYDPGVGSTRTLHISGQAALDACRILKQQLAQIGGAAGLGWNDGIAALLEAHDGELVITGTYAKDVDPTQPEYNSFIAYAVEVTVDRDTGAFTIDDVVMAADVGTIVNPVAHRGQIDGGFVYALGAAITEELVLDEGRITNLSFADYKLVTMRDLPPFRVTLIEETSGPGPFGTRGAGELNLSGVGPAIANAVANACGARVTCMPITAERIYAALHAG